MGIPQNQGYGRGRDTSLLKIRQQRLAPYITLTVNNNMSKQNPCINIQFIYILKSLQPETGFDIFYPPKLFPTLMCTIRSYQMDICS